MGERRQRELSLQAPLVVMTSQIEGERKYEHSESSSPLTEILEPPPLSFLFRMYVACDVLQLSTETRFTAIVLLHRYVVALQSRTSEKGERIIQQLHDNKEWPWVGAACIFLACKAEEELRRLRDVINLVHMVLSSAESPDLSQAAEISDSLRSRQVTVLHVTRDPPPLDEQYWDAKKRVIETEQAVLRWLGFDCFVSHPHRAVFHLLSKHKSAPGVDQKSEEILPVAFRHLNDALFYTRALQFSAVELASSAIELAIEELGCYDRHESTDSRPLKPSWWTQYDVSTESLNFCKACLLEASSVLKVSSTSFATNPVSLHGDPLKHDNGTALLKE
jgi:hypothetical protein